MHFEQRIAQLGLVTDNGTTLEAERSQLLRSTRDTPAPGDRVREHLADRPAEPRTPGPVQHNHQDRVPEARNDLTGIYGSDLGRRIITAPELAAEAVESFLFSHVNPELGSAQNGLAKSISSIARLAIDYIGNSDALYHNIEHTMLVTFVGYDIMRGRALVKPTLPSDYAHFIAACLLHDIGYLRGVLEEDSAEGYLINAVGGRVRLPRGSSDAALVHHHVDRSKLFVMDRIAIFDGLDAARICHAIEFTRFPTCTDGPDDNDYEEGCLMRAADLIGQLGDPNYLRKANALYHEFEEVGLNTQLGYASPADLVELFPHFYWNHVSSHIQTAIQYLNLTPSGRQWIANLYSNLFRAEQGIYLSGPET
jgi:hypothetical protein